MITNKWSINCRHVETHYLVQNADDEHIHSHAYKRCFKNTSGAVCVDVNRQYAWLCSPSSVLSALTVRTLRFDLEMKRNQGPLRVSLEKLFYILVPFRSVWCDLDCTGQWAVAIMATPLFEPDTKRPVQLQVAAKDTWQSRLWWTKCALAAGGIVAPCLHYSGCFLQIMPPQLHHIQIPPTAGSSGMLPITISIIMSLLIMEEAS